MSETLVTRNFQLTVQKREADPEASQSQNLVLEFPFSSEDPYLRSNWFDEPWVEILGHKEGEIDLTRLNAGAPVLLNHGRDATENAPVRSVGVTKRAWIENGRGYVEVKMSRREGMEPILQDIEDGILQNVSVGYRINERTLIQENKDSPNEYRVTSWLPLEVTLCDIPADATVGIGRSINQEAKAVEKETQAVEKQEPVIEAQRTIETQKVDVEAIKSEALATERRRITEIKKMCRSVALDDEVSDGMIERGISIDDARKETLEALAKRTDKPGVTSRMDIETIRDETETRSELMSEAILHRANPGSKLSDGARQYAGMTMVDVCRDILESAGTKTRGMDRMQIATRAFQGTSDFTNVLANVANKSLRKAYDAAPRTFTSWARQATAADFKTISRVSLSDAPALTKVDANGEYTRGTVTDGKETYELATYGKIVGITRQAIINDDLSAFTRIPGMLAVAAANIESDIVYGILTANAALADSVALFHATHANLTGTGTVISVDSLTIGRKSIRIQKTPKLAPMNLAPRFLIVPAALETVAWQFTAPPIFPTAPSSANPFMGELVTVVEARLDAASATAWYLAADTSQIDTVEYCYLEGQNGAYIETRQGFDVDGMEIKVRSDFAAKALDYRGLYKNVGA